SAAMGEHAGMQERSVTQAHFGPPAVTLQEQPPSQYGKHTSGPASGHDVPAPVNASHRSSAGASASLGPASAGAPGSFTHPTGERSAASVTSTARRVARELSM